MPGLHVLQAQNASLAWQNLVYEGILLYTNYLFFLGCLPGLLSVLVVEDNAEEGAADGRRVIGK